MARKWTPAEKANALAHARDVGQYRAATDLDIPLSTLNRWVTQAREHAAGPAPVLTIVPSPHLPPDTPTEQLEGIVLAAGEQIVAMLAAGTMSAPDLVRLWTAAFDRWHAHQTATIVAPSPVDLDDSEVEGVVDELLARAV